MQSGPHYFTRLKIVASLLMLMTATNFAMAQSSEFIGNADRGKAVFKKCAACHKIGASAKNSVGPVLNNVLGRQAGSFAGYKYGKSMLAAGQKGLVWTPETVFAYLASPKVFLKEFLGDPKAKAKMALSLKKQDDRKNVIAYLHTISTQPVTQPATQSSTSSMPQPVKTEKGVDLQPGKICIINKSDAALFLTSEIDGGERRAAIVAAGGMLCAAAVDGQASGKVAVFENENAMEGCTRLAKTGHIEVLVSYASFDNCAWQ